jgi:branched-subunit amino acid ABC-type transport system permease component
MLEQLAQLAVTGLITGSILALTGVGASLVFGIQRVANLAHGDHLTVGAYVAFVGNVGLRQNLVVAAACGMVATAIFAVLAHYGLFRPLRGRGTIAVSLITVGLGVLIRDTSFLVAGSQVRLYAVSQSDVIQVGFLRLSPGQTVAIGVALVVAPATALFLARTRLGKAMRAIADNRDLAAIAGIDVERMAVYVWILAGGLAGLGGVMLALAQGAFDPNLGVALRAVPELSVRPPIVPIPLGSLTGRPVDIDEETRARA